MTEETQARIFEPFFTTKERRQGHRPGPGDGLRHRQAKRRHIEVDSERRPGHQVSDLSTCRCQPSGHGRAPAAPGHAPRARETVLLVEDDEAGARA